MIKILANDGLSTKGINLLQNAGFEVITTKVAQEQVANYINQHQIEVLLVRSATKVTKELIEQCPSLRIIGRGGVGTDSIDVNYAVSKNIKLITTPKASANAVAELVFAHLLSGVRYLYDANRNMPLDGDTQFNQLKKAYANGIELRGKTLGIVGFGNTGKAVAKIGLGLGMNVVTTPNKSKNNTVRLDFYNEQFLDIEIQTKTFEEILKESDFITLHVPAQDGYLLSKKEFDLMKEGVGLINCSRGELINEVDLVDALDAKKVAFAGLDVFQDEPTPAVQILMHPNISLSPHIGASTIEAQDQISIELAEEIISLLKN